MCCVKNCKVVGNISAQRSIDLRSGCPVKLPVILKARVLGKVSPTPIEFGSADNSLVNVTSDLVQMPKSRHFRNAYTPYSLYA